MEPIVTIVGLVVFAVGLLAYLLFKNEEDGAVGYPILGAIICAICLLLTSTEVVQSNTVELPITFGKIGNPMEPGLHVKNPFTRVVSFPTSNYISSRLQSKVEGDMKDVDCVEAIDANLRDVCVDITVVVRLNPSKVKDLYKQYPNLDKAKSGHIRTSTNSAIIETARSYTYNELSIGYKVEGESKIYFKDELTPVLKSKLNDLALDLVTLNVGKSNLMKESDRNAYLKTSQATQDAKTAIETRKQQLTEAETARQKAELDAKTAIIKAQGVADARNVEAASLTPAALTKAWIDAIDKAGTIIVTDGTKTDLMLAPTPTTVK